MARVGKARRLLLCIAAALPAGFAAPPASACVFLPVVCVGSEPECNPSPDELHARQLRWSAEETRSRLAEARNRLRRGQVDFAAELAELLVPNIRPIVTQFSDCGPEGEIDYGAGRVTPEAVFQAVTAGTPLAGSAMGDFAALLRREALSPLGPACNLEFRQGFAAFLRQSVNAEDLTQAWLFLSARQRTHGTYGSLYHRLVRFDGSARTPPVHLALAHPWLRDEVAGALRRTSWGRSIAAAANVFWASHAAELADDARACPTAAAEWAGARQRLIALMLNPDEARRRRRGTGQ